jgi:hypothetical protein
VPRNRGTWLRNISHRLDLCSKSRTTSTTRSRSKSFATRWLTCTTPSWSGPTVFLTAGSTDSLCYSRAGTNLPSSKRANDSIPTLSSWCLLPSSKWRRCFRTFRKTQTPIQRWLISRRWGQGLDRSTTKRRSKQTCHLRLTCTKSPRLSLIAKSLLWPQESCWSSSSTFTGTGSKGRTQWSRSRTWKIAS